jgi:hypothetical protein
MNGCILVDEKERDEYKNSIVLCLLDAYQFHSRLAMNNRKNILSDCNLASLIAAISYSAAVVIHICMLDKASAQINALFNLCSITWHCVSCLESINTHFWVSKMTDLQAYENKLRMNDDLRNRLWLILSTR